MAVDKNRSGASRIVSVVGVALAAGALAVGAHYFDGPASGSSRSVADTCRPGEDVDVYNLGCVPEIAPGPPSQEFLTICSGGSRNDCVRENLYHPEGPPWVKVPDVDTSVNQSP